MKILEELKVVEEEADNEDEETTGEAEATEVDIE